MVAGSDDWQSIEDGNVGQDYRQIEWDTQLEDDCRQLVRLAVREDLDRVYDWTTVALVSERSVGRAVVVARSAGMVAGMRAVEPLVDEYDRRIEWSPRGADGMHAEAGQELGELAGPSRSLLAIERPLLNLLGHLSGIATTTRRYVDAVAGTTARIYDTRKTLPGWRRLEKYAVRQGGGRNHRLGLFDGILIKDNHLALGSSGGAGAYSPAQAVQKARDFLAALTSESRSEMLIEVEVDTLEQLAEVLPARPDIVLVDNMPPDRLKQAVELRNRLAPEIELEASGGVRLETVRELALAGVERISVGALTHSAPWLDVGLDWRPAE